MKWNDSGDSGAKCDDAFIVLCRRKLFNKL